MNEAFLQLAGVFSQLELAMISARVRSGMENARAKGANIGIPHVTKEDKENRMFPLKHTVFFFIGAPQRIRIPDLLIRSQTLYPAELAAHINNDNYYITKFYKMQEVIFNFLIFIYF